MVLIGGDIAFVREDWLVGLGAEEHEEHLERLWAWGKRMFLATSYVAETGRSTPASRHDPAALIAAYPNIGPVFA